MKTVALGAIAEIVSGATPKSQRSEYWGGDVPWVTPADLSKLEDAYIAITPRTLTKAGLASCAARVLPAGSVLLSSRAPIGHVAINSVPMATNQGFKSFVPRNDKLHTKYLYHWLCANKVLLQGMGNGATFKELSKSTVERIGVPLPAVEEQRRIAAILDQADAIRAKPHRAKAFLDELQHANFVASFGDPSGWVGRWPMATIEDLAESFQYGTSAKSGMVGEYPILRMGNITASGRLDLSDLKYIDFDAADFDKFSARRGDLLFNRTNSPELVGKTAVVDTDVPLVLAGYLVRVRFLAEHRSEFVSAYLNSRYGKVLLRGMAKGAINQANISASELKKIPIAAPPANIQNQFALDQAAIEGVRARLEAQLVVGDALFASLQSRAFRGEL